jgi:hypothetical protein
MSNQDDKKFGAGCGCGDDKKLSCGSGCGSDDKK